MIHQSMSSLMKMDSVWYCWLHTCALTSSMKEQQHLFQLGRENYWRRVMDEFTNYIELAELTTFILVYDCWTLLEQFEPGQNRLNGWPSCCHHYGVLCTNTMGIRASIVGWNTGWFSGRMSWIQFLLYSWYSFLEQFAHIIDVPMTI